MESLFLSLALAFSGITVVNTHPSCINPDTMGEYHISEKLIALCEDNIHNRDITTETVLKHEVIHAVHTNLGMVEPSTLLPDWLLTQVVTKTMSQSEVFSVVVSYEYPQQELEARVLEHTPGHAVGFLLLYSEFYSNL